MDLEQLGPYRLGRHLGRGGMGTVFAAVDEQGNEVAVKVLSAALGREEGFRERFAAEIESLRKLNHPNIVRIFGYGEQQEYQYYAMELVHGRSLEEAIQSGRRFDWEEVTEIGVQCCRALKHAHDRGVIHRDIKPANLLLAEDGLIKLSDFGIAKLFGNAGLTGDGGVLGTAEYMAPEQADGRAVTQLADLYSLGGVLYTLTAGRPPFVASSLVEMLQLQRFAEPEPVRRLAPRAPAELEDIILSLLDKNPERRIRNAQVLSRRLEAMRHALLRRAARQEAGEGRSAPKHDPTRPDPNAVETQVSPDDLPRSPYADSFKDTSDHVAQSDDDPPLAPELSRAMPPASRFTPVDKEEHRRREMIDDEQPAWIAPQTWLLIAAIVAVAALGWWLLQPPSADKLYEEIVAAASEDRIERLVEAESSIDSFLRHYPSDPRVQRLNEYQDEIDLYKLQRQLEVRSRRINKSDSLAPIERAYLEAINYSRIDPSLGQRKLQALVALHDGDENPSKLTSQYLELARERLAALDKQIAAFADDDREMLARRLDRAEELAADEPKAARDIWQAVVELYADKPWAAEHVERARTALAGEAE